MFISQWVVFISYFAVLFCFCLFVCFKKKLVILNSHVTLMNNFNKSRATTSTSIFRLIKIFGRLIRAVLSAKQHAILVASSVDFFRKIK